MDKSVLEITKQDLLQDFDHLLSLFTAEKTTLEKFEKEITEKRKHIISSEHIQKLAHQYLKDYGKTIERITSDKKTITNAKTTEQIKNLLEKKQFYFDEYRTYQSIISGLLASADWQSPSVEHSIISNAGRQTGTVIVSYSDYKRDYHLDVREYEVAFKKAYIHGLLKFRIPVYLTNSGMAALTTILNFLEMERKITGPILLGSSSYFQNKELIKRLFTGVYEVHEHDTEKVKEIITTKQPAVLFFDSLCNSHDIAIPNLFEIVETVKKTAKKDTYIIIDNTCLAASFQPLQLLGKLPKNVHMIVFESMNKYYQFGADKTIGGIIYTWGKDTDNFFYIRQHSGTIMPDIDVFQLPTPNKKILLDRLSRHERNTDFLVNTIEQFISDDHHNPLEKIVYPTLENHPAHRYAKKLSFHGSFFTFVWKKKYDTIKNYKRFITLLMQEAKKENVQLVMGTSFGLNTSRIYLTAPNTKYGKPFVRFSSGTETAYEVEKLKQTLIETLEKL